MEYNETISKFRDQEYPMLKGKIYLDHGGTTIYAKSLIDTFSINMLSNLYGNPHSASSPAKLSGEVVDSTREKALRFFGADPEYFDLVFVANATAGMKIVMEAFRDLASTQSTTTTSISRLQNPEIGWGNSQPGSFRYGYHKDSHTSLVGIREVTHGNYHCFTSNTEIESWIQHPPSSGVEKSSLGNQLGLFAYPAQSNMTGTRLPLTWPLQIRSSPHHQNTFTLLDAAAFACTSPLSPIFQNPDSAPDFTVLSFYKIFGYPDLGALIVRKESGHVLSWRKYFGGGTIDMATVLGGDIWYKSKWDGGGEGVELHDVLEDGTVAFHSVLALDSAISVHERLYGSMKEISSHVSYLIGKLYHGMKNLYYTNSQPVCKIYDEESFSESPSTYGHGATIAFNILTPQSTYIPYTLIEKLSNTYNIFVRTGGLCNPGGIASFLKLEPWQMKRAWSAGHRCSKGDVTGTDLVGGRPTGVVRVSLGAMSTMGDVEGFLRWLKGEFVLGDGGRIGDRGKGEGRRGSFEGEDGGPVWEVVQGL